MQNQSKENLPLNQKDETKQAARRDKHKKNKKDILNNAGKLFEEDG